MEKVLIVEDEYGQVAVSALMAMGHDAVLASNLEDAMSKLEENQFLFCVTDLNFPDNKSEKTNPNGLNVRKKCAEKNTPVIMLTAGFSNQHKQEKVEYFLSEDSMPIKVVWNQKKSSATVWKLAVDLIDRGVLKARKRMMRFLSI